MSNQNLNPNNKKIYELKERTGKFGENIVKFAQSLPQNAVYNPLISQLVRAGTSVGGNYMEADCAESKRDFNHKIGICKKEANETMHWLRMIAVGNPPVKEECRIFWKEAHELVLIFSTIIRKK